MASEVPDSIEIEIHDPTGEWARGRYLVHELTVSLWSDDFEEVVAFIRNPVREHEEKAKDERE